ncbi:MAG: LlaJI family restriction endonuclease [Treponema sp.]|nr:LlaJI family restriction endonuclease [Treponema sp.]
MTTAYFREGQHYSLKNLSDKLSLDLEKTKNHIVTLKKYSILKTVRNVKPDFSDLSDQDVIIGEIPEDSSDFTYQFTYVGIILLDDVLLLCYPKYIDLDESKKDQIFYKFKTIIKVLQKYNQKEQLVQLYNGEEESKQFNRLAISLHILMDYFENGLYSNQKEIIELNGEGEILWDKTINETFAYIKNSTPYYLNAYTQDNTENDFDYIRRLHAAIVSQASRDLDKEKLLELFSLSPAELTEESLDDFGDVDFIKYRLEQEIKSQFVTRKQSLLKTLYAYISEAKSNKYDSSFSLYGTNSFNLVWESACATLFDDAIKTHKRVSQFEKEGLIKLDDSNDIYKNYEISDFIEKPEWIIDGKKLSYKGDLIPDIVSLQRTNDGNAALYILDGKYYILQIEGDYLTGNPGIQDVIKQYIYNASLRNFINAFKIAEVANAFLIPSLIKKDEEGKCITNESKDIENIGQVPYWTVQKSSFKELPDVQVVRIKPEYVWDLYLKNQKLPQEFWKEIRTSPREQDKHDTVRQA